MMIRRSLKEKAEFVRSVVEASGKNVNPSSRIGRMHSVLCKSLAPEGGIINVNDPQFLVAREAVKDLQILSFIFDNLPESSHPSLKAKLRLLIKDSVLPQADEAESQGRDIQHELFVAAVAAAAGMNPQLAEPDVLASIDKLEFGIAAKRIKSLENLENNIRSAANQIHDSGRLGLIAIDIAAAMHPSNDPILRPVTPELFDRAAENLRQGFVREYEHQIREACRGKEVRGIIVHDHHVTPDPSNGWGLNGFHFPISCSKGNQRRDKEFGRIYNGYLRGLPNRA